MPQIEWRTKWQCTPLEAELTEAVDPAPKPETGTFADALKLWAQDRASVKVMAARLRKIAEIQATDCEARDDGTLYSDLGR